MASLWVADVQARLQALEGEAGEEGDDGDGIEDGPCPYCGVPGLFHEGAFADCPSRPVELICEECGNPLRDYGTNGRTYTVSQLVDIGQSLRDGGVLCGPCLKKRKAAAREEAA